MKFFIYTLVFLVLFACSNSSVYKKNISLDEMGWDYSKILDYNFDIDNTNQNYNLFVDLKYKKTYPYSNVFFFVDIKDPNQKLYRDTIELPLASATGKWLGESSGEYIRQQLVYRYNINFPTKGTYHIRIQHAMRDSLLIGISGVGIELKEFVKE